MAKAIMFAAERPRVDEYRRWYDDHIAGAIGVVGDMPQAIRSQLVPGLASAKAAPSQFVTLYEIDSDEVAGVQARLQQAWVNDTITKSDIIAPGPVFFWQLDAELAPAPAGPLP
jgi:hypothetical protein